MDIIEKNTLKAILEEKDVMLKANHPFLVGLKCAFQTKDKIFFVMPYLRGGD